MTKHLLWIDDSDQERFAAQRMLAPIEGITFAFASSSDEAEQKLTEVAVDCVVTDILRRHDDHTVSTDDGYEFFRSFIRPNWPTLPVIFHTKNLPHTFSIDEHSQYLSKWESEAKKSIELEIRLNELVQFYEAFAAYEVWKLIEPRLVTVRSYILDELRTYDDIWKMKPKDFEQLVAELLEKIGYDVLWIPGGKDQGIDIVAGSRDHTLLLDVKRYSPSNPVEVELVRHVYGVAAKVQDEQPPTKWHGGIITSSRFTSGADMFKNSVRARPLLRDGEWLRNTLGEYAPLLARRTRDRSPPRMRPSAEPLSPTSE